MLMNVEGAGWKGEVVITDPPIADAMASAQIWVESEVSGDRAIAGLEYLLALIAGGRQGVIRVKPEVFKEQDFDTKGTRWRGVARLSFALGSAQKPKQLGKAHWPAAHFLQSRS